jgi:ligand-binding sensor domain-containing protein
MSLLGADNERPEERRTTLKTILAATIACGLFTAVTSAQPESSPKVNQTTPIPPALTTPDSFEAQLGRLKFFGGNAPTPPDEEAQISEYVREVFQDREGHFWFGTNGDGVCRYDGKSLTYLSVEQGFGGRAVRGILQDSDGVMWFATDGGVSRFENGKFTNYTGANGLSSNQVWSMMRDRAGTIWVGTQEGVCRFDGKSFVAFPIPRVEVEKPASRFTPKVVFSMFQDQAGNLWFGTDGEGAHKYDGKTFTSYTTKEGLAGNQVRSIGGDRRGRIWLGTDGDGVSCYEGTAFRTYTTKDGLNNDRIFEILEDKAGNMWFSTLGAGACRYDGKSFTPFREDRGLTRTHVQSMFEDKDGILWFGCSGGLFRFDGKSFINVTRKGPWQMPL